MTSVEKASTQALFIRKVAQTLDDSNLHLVKGDALRYIEASPRSFDIVFADPPYDLPGFAEIPGKVLASRLLHPGSLFVLEHSGKHDFSSLPHFLEHRAYGSVNFSLFRIPYAALTAVLTAVLAFIPYVGAFSSCAIAALLTLLAQPEKTLLCIIVYQAVQFVENQFIYPHVVGSSVGLAPIWTLVAALLGGQLFGLVGIIFFIPLTAVVCQLTAQSTNRRLQTKGRSPADAAKAETAPPEKPRE